MPPPPDAAGLFQDAKLAPTDETPTVVSKKAPAPLRPEETLAGMLRGRMLAHFELIEPIGVGGMAAVLRARDTQLDRTVALKILPPESATDPDNVLRFHQEARAAAKLDHENIARVFFCGEDQGLHFIAFEFVEGENLRTVLERRGRLPVPEAVHYMLQIATGLAHAAARGVVHRDIKPSNLIISRTRRAKLVDMGLARSLGPQTDGGLTHSGVTLGTFDYISPEQALEPRDADVRSDIYSLGCTFYHMLTGHPPVPEGTAAKKLRHHQMVAPPDPRQFNPDIPDEVAALLARMMAKDPKDRYQRPEELVQHLLVVANKVGTGADGPDGVLFVDAALPGPPRTRPVLLIVGAVAALFVLLAVLGQANLSGPGPSRRTTDLPSGKGDEGGARPGPEAGSQGGEQNGSAAAALRPDTPAVTRRVAREIHSEEDLLHALSEKLDADATLELTLKTDVLELTSLESLILARRNVVIQADRDVPLPKLKRAYNASEPRKSWALLTVRGGKLRLVGLRLEVDAREAADTLSVLRVEDGGRLTLEGCELVQTRLPSVPGGAVASVLVKGLPEDKVLPSVQLDHCYFAPGQYAVRFLGPARVQASDCLFAPQAALFQFPDDASADQESSIRMAHCTALFTHGTGFQLGRGTEARVTVTNSLFSRPEEEGAATLFEQTGPSVNLDFTGTRNGYHNFKTYWKSPGQEGVTSLAALALAHPGVENHQCVEVNPWPPGAQPLAALRNNPRQAFLANLQLAELRLPDDRTRLLGAWQGPFGPLYATPLPTLEARAPAEAVAARREFIVDPRATEIRNGIYRSLESALLDVTRPGEVIRIRHNGPLPVKPVRLKAQCDVTLQPADKYHPILTLGETLETAAVLFHLHDGKLTFKDLEFTLRPTRPGFATQTVVQVQGAGQCLFERCVVTVEEQEGADLAVVRVTDPTGLMRVEPRPGVPASARIPAVSFQNSFVRGAGDLLTVHAGRPFTLDVENSLAALSGSLLNLEGNGDESAAGGPGALSAVSLKQVTAYLSENLIQVKASQAGKPLHLARVAAQANGCLLIPGGKKPLVYLDGVDAPEQLTRLFSWRGEHNAYGSTIHLLEMQLRDTTQMTPPQFDRPEWERTWGESDGRFFPKIRLANPPEPGASLARATKEDFRAKADPELQGYGAAVEALPRPADEPLPGTAPER